MRPTLVPALCAFVSLVGTPVTAQHALPATPFEASLPAVTPTPAPPVQEWWRNGGPRIRTQDQRIATALRTGLERSRLFRALVDRIDASNVVVYAGVDPRMTRALMGRLVFAGQAGDYRYLRVTVSPELSSEPMVAALAHELQHVVEVVEHPEVTSERSLSALYTRIGQSNRAGGLPGWETTAAIDMGMEVRRELNIGTPAAVARRDADLQRDQRH